MSIDHEDVMVVLMDDEEADATDHTAVSPHRQCQDDTTAQHRPSAAMPTEDGALLERGRRQVDMGDTCVDVGLVPMAGFNAIERLRHKRSRLLVSYVCGCAVVVFLFIIALWSTMHRQVRIAPTEAFIAQVDNIDVTPDSLRMTAEGLIVRMHTWSSTNSQDVVQAVVPFLDPKIRENVRANYERLEDGARRSNFTRIAMPIGSVYRGSRNDIHEVWVAYEKIEATGTRAEDSSIHRRVRSLAVMSFVVGVATDDNLRGIYLLRLQDYEEEEWRRLGGPDVWGAMRTQARERSRAQ